MMRVSILNEGAMLATKWQVTRAVRASDLPAPARLVMLVLADVAEAGTAEIPERFTPSLRVLARETGLNESTVTRKLNELEVAGWVVRIRPTLEDARMKGERTRYRLDLPAGVVAQNTVDRAESTEAIVHEASGLGAESTEPGCTVQPIKEEPRSLPDQNQITNNHVGRADVAEICSYLADKIEDNGSRRPVVNDRWRDAARRLLDRDGRTVEQVKRAIDWCQTDPFWRANILSMPKLREKYDQLRLAAARPRGQPARTNGQDIDWDAAMERAEARERNGA